MATHEKQIGPSAKANLIRRAFYLLLLIAVCIIHSRWRGETPIHVWASRCLAQIAAQAFPPARYMKHG